MTIFFICNKDRIKYFIDYLNSIKTIYSNIGLFLFDVKLTNNYYPYENKILKFIINNFNYSNIFIFFQSIPNLFLNEYNLHPYFYLLNTEQNTTNGQFYQSLIRLPQSIKIIDYSKENIKYLQDNNIHKNTIYLPYQVNTNEIFNFEKIFDIAIIGLQSDRRQYIYEEISSQNKINIINGFGISRDVLLMKHKILVNIHYDNNYKIFEQFRCNRCILNKMIVITETSDLSDYELKDYVIMCDYNELAEKCIEVINNYDYYYDKLFANFDVEKIKEKYKITTESLF